MVLVLAPDQDQPLLSLILFSTKFKGLSNFTVNLTLHHLTNYSICVFVQLA